MRKQTTILRTVYSQCQPIKNCAKVVPHVFTPQQQTISNSHPNRYYQLRHYSTPNPFTNQNENRYTIDDTEKFIPLALQEKFTLCQSLVKEEKKREQALTILNQIIQEYQTVHHGTLFWNNAHVLRACVLVELSRFDEALKDVQLTLQYDPLSMKVRHLRAICYTQLQMYQQALDDYKDVIFTVQSDFTPRLERARLYRHLWTSCTNDNKEHYKISCIHDYSTIVDHSDTNLRITAALELANIYSLDNQIDDSLRYYQIAQSEVEKSNNRSDIPQEQLLKLHEGLSLVYSALENVELALEHTNHCVTLSPHPNFKMKRAILYRLVGQSDKALEDLSNVDDSLITHVIRAHCYADLGNKNAALTELRRAEVLNTSDKSQSGTIEALRQHLHSL